MSLDNSRGFRTYWSSPGWSGGTPRWLGTRGALRTGGLSGWPFGHHLHYIGKCLHLAADLIKHLPTHTLFTLMDSFLLFTVASKCPVRNPNGAFHSHAEPIHFTAYHLTVSLYAFHLVFLTQLACLYTLSNSFVSTYAFQHFLSICVFRWCIWRKYSAM